MCPLNQLQPLQKRRRRFVSFKSVLFLPKRIISNLFQKKKKKDKAEVVADGMPDAGEAELPPLKIGGK
jgi:hypothetical protein